MPRIYLHIFDRELRNFCQSQMTDKDISEIVLMACLLSDEVYVPYSNLMESYDRYPNSVNLVLELERGQFCRIITSEDNIGGFINSHQQLYRFVKENYSIYFDKQFQPFPTIPYVPRKNTTSVLREEMQNRINEGLPRPLNKIDDELYKIISDPERGAITIGNISHNLQLTPEQHNQVAKLISQSYSKRYLDEICGTYISKLPYLWCLDEALGKSTLRYKFYLSILRPFFLDKWFDANAQKYPVEETLYALMTVKNDTDAMAFILDLMRCSNTICRRFDTDRKECNRRLKNLSVSLTFRSTFDYKAAIDKLIMINNLMRNEGIAPINEEFQTKRVLLVVATDLEFKVVTQFYRDKKGKLLSWNANGISFILVGRVGKCEVHLVRCAMGSHGALGSIQTIEHAVAGMKPDYLVMVGIAYSLKDKIKIGDILVSTSIVDGETGKETVNKNNEPIFQSRGLNITADDTLWQAFSTAFATMDNPPEVHCGTIVTGSAVIDSKKKKAEIIKRFPNAIGGEMEGNGLLANPQIPWILVKAVCDDGENKSDEFQVLAAHNAIEYVDYVLTTL